MAFERAGPLVGIGEAEENKADEYHSPESPCAPGITEPPEFISSSSGERAKTTSQMSSLE